jgi:hypothetical protein
MYTATVFEKSARQPMLDKYFKEKSTSGMNERLQTEWLDDQIQVRLC